jgi:hypothetical protein
MHVDGQAFAASTSAASSQAGGLPSIAPHHPGRFVPAVGDRTLAGV